MSIKFRTSNILNITVLADDTELELAKGSIMKMKHMAARHRGVEALRTHLRTLIGSYEQAKLEDKNKIDKLDEQDNVAVDDNLTDSCAVDVHTGIAKTHENLADTETDNAPKETVDIVIENPQTETEGNDENKNPNEN